MHKSNWLRKIDWVKSGSTYYKQYRDEIYKEKRYIAVGDIYFKLNKYLTGITFTYVNSLDNIYKIDLLTGDGLSIVNNYNEYDAIDRCMENLIFVDVASDENVILNFSGSSYYSNQQVKEINGVKLKPGHLVLLKSQNNSEQNDIYIVNNNNFLQLTDNLSDRVKSYKFSCSVKLGKNADKQFFLDTNLTYFPISFEQKKFIEGQSFLIKHLIKYNLYNTLTGSTDTSKIIFSDFDFARKQLPENYELYNDIYISNLPTTTTPSEFIKINYHRDSYIIRSGTADESIISSNVLDISNNISYTYTYGYITGFTSILFPVNFNPNINDYLLLTIYSGNTGNTLMYMYNYIKDIQGSYIFLKETIPNKIINDLKYYTFELKNLNVAVNWEESLNIFKKYTPYTDFYNITIIPLTGLTNLILSTKVNDYEKYFDYDGLSFYLDGNPVTGLTFHTDNQYVNYNLYDRLNQINSAVFTDSFSFFNSYVLNVDNYEYPDNSKIVVKSSITGLTNIFVPYTYVIVNASLTTPQRTLVYSVKENEIVLQKPVNWIDLYPLGRSDAPVISSIQNIDGLKNISDILYEVYMNEPYDWYINRSDNERKYIANAYGELLHLNPTFRSNVTGLLYENLNHEPTLKLYNLGSNLSLSGDTSLYYEPNEIVFVGADKKTRLPLPLNLNALETTTTTRRRNSVYPETTTTTTTLPPTTTTTTSNLVDISWYINSNTFTYFQIYTGTTTGGTWNIVVDVNYSSSGLFNMLVGSYVRVVLNSGDCGTASVYINGYSSNGCSSVGCVAETVSQVLTSTIAYGVSCDVTTTTTTSTTTTTQATTTTTTTTIFIEPTTTTTTIYIADIYYGVSSDSRVTESTILSTFNTLTGYVGSPTGRLYLFDVGNYYKYWCIKDQPNSGERVIKQLISDDVNVVTAYDGYYVYYQMDPDSPIGDITYGKITINGIVYRIYRTITKSSAQNDIYVYSF